MIHNIISLLLLGIGIDNTLETMSYLLVPAKDSQITQNVERMSELILAFFLLTILLRHETTEFPV